MEHIRNLSARPDLVIDPAGNRIVDSAADPLFAATTVGMQGPFGRERVVAALKGKCGPVQIAPKIALCDNQGYLLVDPYTNFVVGESNGVWVHRMLAATRTHDTRRL